jgi:hypothetical protein
LLLLLQAVPDPDGLLDDLAEVGGPPEGGHKTPDHRHLLRKSLPSLSWAFFNDANDAIENAFFLLLKKLPILFVADTWLTASCFTSCTIGDTIGFISTSS